MKSLFISLSLFLAMLGAILWNGQHFAKITRQYESMVREAAYEEPEKSRLILSDLAGRWRKTADVVQITVSHTRVDNITALIDSMLSGLDANDEGEYKKSAALLLNAFAELRLMEEFTFINIF